MDDWEAMKNNEKCKNGGGLSSSYDEQQKKRDQMDMAKLLSCHI
jgi:hypothetical protein